MPPDGFEPSTHCLKSASRRIYHAELFSQKTSSLESLQLLFAVDSFCSGGECFDMKNIPWATLFYCERCRFSGEKAVMALQSRIQIDGVTDVYFTCAVFKGVCIKYIGHVPPDGFEPSTHCLKGRCSTRLSYRGA